MKLILENWRQYLTESHEGCPEKHPRGDYKVYYDVDRFDPPPIEDILNCWVKNHGYVYDSSVNSREPAFYDTEDLTPYREYTKDGLRNPPGTERYEELKADIGVVKIGEGNHRHEIAMSLGIPKVPVRFVFWRNVSLKQ